jgi:dihydropteroate synthase
MQTGDLSYTSLLVEIIEFLGNTIDHALTAGISEESIVIDPGIGFGKTGEDNLKILKNLSEFKVLGRPILIGVSRKAFIGKITGGTPLERTEGTAAAVTASIVNGANIVRVHDVKAMKKVVVVADAIIRA